MGLLLLAYTQAVRCRLALRDFAGAGDLSSLAVKLLEWKGQALLTQALPGPVLNSSVERRDAENLPELHASVAKGCTALQMADKVIGTGRLAEARALLDPALKRLQSVAWNASGPLQAELLAVRGEVALQDGNTSDALADAENAMAFDEGCERARSLLVRLGPSR